VGDDRAIYEKICLEGFQSGLSWLTVLRKRAAFRSAFAGFEPATVARFGEREVSRLLVDAGIIRHRQKIEAAVANARAVLALWSEGQSLAGMLWAHEPSPAGPAPSSTSDIAAWTVQSKALSGALRSRGFRFVGPSTLYAAMQSLGVVNDHLTGCHRRAACDTERAGFPRPRP
jgi:DNA-3-methyladenine glycosylase I